MSITPAEISRHFTDDTPASWVSNLWDKYNNQRAPWLDQKQELRNYLFATDTSTTSNSDLPWKNSTTIPKICQIRDNLHSNYLSSLFPHDRWLTWKAFNKEAASKEKAEKIQQYMANKTREARFRGIVSELLLDYIDYGMAVSTCSFEARYKTIGVTEEKVQDYVGPIAHRISPQDIVFNPTARSFEESFKIIRSVKTIGELKALALDDPDQTFWAAALEKRETLRRLAGSYGKDDFNKAQSFSIDGFGSYYEYLMSDYVEVLEFYGDYHNTDGELNREIVITVVDRATTVRKESIPSWLGMSGLFNFVGWRKRTDNLYPMGPLDNIVGLQYRLDHLENAAADAMDMAIHPPLVVAGNVDEFNWQPEEVIYIDEGGTINELGKNLNAVITAASKSREIMDHMENMAGSPREAMGIRTPGEKTATEVNTLHNAAGRVFQEKITNFEIHLLEPLLNSMLETASRHLNETDLIGIMNSAGVEVFKEITKEDITAHGVLRPIGARHFAKQAQDLQNVISIFNSPIAEMIKPHTSGLELTKFVNDVTGLLGYDIFKANVGVSEGADTQREINRQDENIQAELGVDL